MDVDVDAIAIGAPDNVGKQVGRQQSVAAGLGSVAYRERAAPRCTELSPPSMFSFSTEARTSSDWNSRAQRFDHRHRINVRVVVVVGAYHPERQLALPLEV